jgi:hypothetical protein
MALLFDPLMHLDTRCMLFGFCFAVFTGFPLASGQDKSSYRMGLPNLPDIPSSRDGDGGAFYLHMPHILQD